MLILYRELGESIIIDRDTRIRIVELDMNFVKLGFSAPREISIVREELYNKRYREREREKEFREREYRERIRD